MFAVLKSKLDLINGEKGPNRGESVEIPAGRYELERVANPPGHKVPWLVLKGTMTGMAEGAWREYDDPLMGNRRITFEE